ncbi:MAG: undecaprenyldiphospho-muramoylpentapeptide beta-N-acetylglucosaminyltransferase [Myxococcota bacterium]|jgi:UDP-N-acetylglucosamine--N-acetylmuramyl-(pentapeptide) pyrophosphoryl-undecaprenol N-acetylglucosamine transferase|nr:undecaprenyldiphospho-muramoylpentapeptide beta-N-acetylglucosaminyltransferase [Myxococcota bacterium]
MVTANAERCIMLAAGGTGGHIFPAIAVADALVVQAPELRCVFVGTEYGLEKRLVSQAGYPLEFIDVRYLKGTSLATKFKHGALLPRAAWQCYKLLRKHKPGLVLGAGGYASGPLVAMASMMDIPTAIMEQNAIPGLTNRLLAGFVDKVFVSFEAERYAFAAHKVRALGNPVRNMSATADAADGRFHLLVFGGSQGARSLNQQLPRILGSLGEAAQTLSVRHQAGRGQADAVREAYANFTGEVEVSEFIDDMPSAYANSQLIVCRAGATSVAEIKAAGRAAVLVPFPRAAHNHQEKNAQAMVDAGAAWMIRDRELEGDRLRELLLECIAHPERLQQRAQAAAALAQPNAARDVAAECLTMCL